MQGDITLDELMSHFKSKYGLEITMLSHGAAMLYCDFGSSKKKMAERRATKVSTLVEQVTQTKHADKTRYLILEACVQQEDGEDEVEM